MAAFTYTIGIMINDLSHSFLMIGILLMAFASALAILNEPPFNSFTEVSADPYRGSSRRFDSRLH